MTFKKFQRMNRYTKWCIFGQNRSFLVKKVTKYTWRSKKFREWTAIQGEAFSGKSGHFWSKKSPQIHCVQKNSENELLYKVRHFRTKAVIFGQKSHSRYIAFKKNQRMNRYTKWGIFGQKRSFSVKKVTVDTSRLKIFREWTAIQSEAFLGKSGHFRSKKLPQVGSMYYFTRACLKWGFF